MYADLWYLVKLSKLHYDTQLKSLTFNLFANEFQSITVIMIKIKLKWFRLRRMVANDEIECDRKRGRKKGRNESRHPFRIGFLSSSLYLHLSLSLFCVLCLFCHCWCLSNFQCNWPPGVINFKKLYFFLLIEFWRRLTRWTR